MTQVTEQVTLTGAPKPMTPLQEFWHYFKRNKGAVIGLVYILLMFIVASGARVGHDAGGRIAVRPECLVGWWRSLDSSFYLPCWRSI